MPLFTRHSDETTAPIPPQKTVVDDEPTRRRSMFGRHRSISPTSTTRTTNSSSRASTAASTNSLSSSSRRSGFLHRHDVDPSIRAAQDRVLSAETAETEADKALLHARAMVRDAREHVKRLEKEAAEEARLAKVKQEQAASISKRARPLGRHDHV